MTKGTILRELEACEDNLIEARGMIKEDNDFYLAKEIIEFTIARLYNLKKEMIENKGE